MSPVPPASKPPRVQLPAGLPSGLRVTAELSRSERAHVLRVRQDREPHDAVLRLGGLEAGSATDAEVALFARVAARGLVAPTAWGRADDGRSWLLRPFIEGLPFDAALREKRPAGFAAARLHELLDGLAALHEAGFVHRDIKAANVIVGAESTSLVDLDLVGAAEAFGAASFPSATSATSATGAAGAAGGPAAAGAGSPFHIAPEVLLGHAHTPRSDLFSVGAMVAFACCGEPSAAFHGRFPGQSFWQASGLDAALLPPELSALVQALVRRHPDDRPVSARAAQALLDPGDEPSAATAESPRELPFLAGREAALARLVALTSRGREPESALVSVRDPEELPELADQLELAVAVAGRRVARVGNAEEPDRMVARVRASAPDAVVLVLADAADIERALALLLAAHDGAPRLLALGSAEQVQALGAVIRERELGADLCNFTLVPWPAVPRGALEQHLRRLTGNASPEMASALAAHGHERTAGRRADLNRLLARAVEDGVLRADGALYTPLRADWPASFAPEAALADEFGALPEAQRALLGALAVLGSPADGEVLREVVADEGMAALRALLARGLLRHDGPARYAATDPRLLDAARHDLEAAGRESWARRCMEVLRRPGASLPATEDRHASSRRATWASLAATVARSDAEWLAVLDSADLELADGHVPMARSLAQAVARAETSPSVARRLALLSARLELVQGRAREALAELQRSFGDDLSGAASDELLAAAEAAELAGRRDEARVWLQRVLDAPAGRAQELDALRGLGYAAWLEGRSQDCLDIIADAPREDDPDGPAVALLNLRGVACVRLQRWPEAEACFSDALRRCEAGGSSLVLARARTELNRAILDRRRGRSAEAVAALQRAEASFDAAGHVSGRALALQNLGVLHRDLGDLTAARALLQEALALRRRTGETHGILPTLGSLALLRLDAGQVGAALSELDTARARLTGSTYAPEAVVLELHRAMALALAGRHVDAAGALVPASSAPGDQHAALRARATALVRACAGELPGARLAAREACRHAQDHGDVAELFRAAALLVALSPDADDAVTMLRGAADQLGSPVRAAELRWRIAARQSLSSEALQELLTCFEQAGRTDLVRVVAQRLAHVADAAGDKSTRRRASARAAEATDALVETLPAAARQPALERMTHLLCGVPEGPDSGTSTDTPRAGQSPAGLDITWLLTCNRRMAAEDDLAGLLLGIVDSALELTGARRGLLVLLEGDAVSVQAARGMDRAAMPEEEARFSLTVVRDAVSSGRTVVTTDAAADSRFRGTQSIESFGLRSVLCVPLRLPGPVTGALYLDNDQQASVFDDTDAERTGWLADQASLAIANLRRRAELQAGAAELAARHEELLAQRAEIESLNARLAARVQVQEQELVTARTLLRQRGSVSPAPGMVGDSEAMQRVYMLIDRLGPTELPVLVTGPSGTGKDLVARALHARSLRADKPLVIENVAALPPTLLESELFGHVRGAFTGAERDRPGLFAEADGGTFFLDEIGDMPLELQAKLLRVLESGEYRPVGGRRNVRVDVRIVAATHRDLPARVREGSFREDLYYRLNGAEIRLPSLVERLDDLPLLVAHFLALLNGKHRTARTLREPVLRALARRAWPGQVRELANEVSRLYFLSGDVIDDPSLVREPADAGRGVGDGGSDAMPASTSASLKLEDAERVAVQRALTAAGGRKDQAARLLGISRAGLYAKLARLGLAPDSAD